MDRLESLGRELREELGNPPEAWLSEQRARVSRALREPPQRRMPRGALLLAATLGVAIGLGAWAIVPRLTTPSVQDVWLVAEELREPFRFKDGSSISLSPGGRGRLLAREDGVRFDLHAGRATFDVIPKQRRPWLVSAGKNEVRVVGTRFSVLYEAGDAFEVEVARGVVSVRVPDRGSSIQLEAGDRFQGRPGRIALSHGGSVQDLPSESVVQPPPAAGPVTVGSASVGASAAAPPAPSGGDWQVSYRQGNYVASLAQAREIGVDKLMVELSPKGLADLADAARLGGDPELAVRALTALQKRFPSSAQAREGKFLLGRVYALRGDKNAAIGSFESYLAQQGAAAYATEAIGRLMELYSERGDTERARAMAERYIERSPEGPYRRLARALLERSR